MTQDEALEILQTGANVFLTGEPGSGKSYTINQYVKYLRDHDIEPAITASTGIAATHIGGMTIHSWSGIGIKNKLTHYDLDKITATEYLAKRIRWTKVLIIDEVSMLAADTLQMVDQVCRAVKQNEEPFGGIQVVLVGDFFQLPPIVKYQPQNNPVVEQGMFDEITEVEMPKSPFAYNAPVWEKARVLTCYLTEQHRQDDKDFLQVLTAIRTDTFSEDHLTHITNRRVEYHSGLEKLTKLFSHNVDVDRVNDDELGKIEEAERVFEMESYGGPEGLLAALKKGCLSPETLALKIGATVMFTKNNPKDGYVNGTLGTVVGFDKLSGQPIVKIKSGPDRASEKITVETAEWVVEENGKVRAGISQLPLRLAWAITVHKSQGMSLDEAVMDLSQVFEYGQGYVALSRVRRLSGLHLLGLNDRVFKVHPEVLEKDAEFREASGSAASAFAKLAKSEKQKMQDNFIRACGGQLIASERASKKPKAKKDTYAETFKLWQEGKNLAEMAKERGMTSGTIIAHLEKLKKENKVEVKDLMRLVSVDLKKHLPAIHAAFAKFGTEQLAPVFYNLKTKFSYDDLKLARLTM